MKKSVKLISTVLVFAMLVSLCSCGKRESGRIKGSERSKTGNGVNDEIQGAFDLLTGAMGKDLDTVKARIKAYFGCELNRHLRSDPVHTGGCSEQPVRLHDQRSGTGRQDRHLGPSR